MKIKDENTLPIIDNEIKRSKSVILNNNEIDNLKRELEDEKNKNKKLKETINNLNNIINQLKQKDNVDQEKYKKDIDNNDIDILNNKIKELTLENNNLKEKIERTNTPNNSDEIVKLYKKIEDLNEKLKRFPFILEKGEKILSVIFTSVSQNVNYSMVCKNTDSIHKLEEELYKAFPELKQTNNYFLCKGSVIDRFEQFEKYKIKNSDIIIINQQND